MADPEQRDCEVCKFVLAPSDQTRQSEQQRDCKLVSVSPDWTNVWKDIKSLSDSNKCCTLSCCKSDRSVGNVHRFQGHLVLYTGTNIPVQSTTIRSVNSTNGIHYTDQRGQTDFLTDWYEDPPVCRRLVCVG